MVLLVTMAKKVTGVYLDSRELLDLMVPQELKVFLLESAK